MSLFKEANGYVRGTIVLAFAGIIFGLLALLFITGQQ